MMDRPAPLLQDAPHQAEDRKDAQHRQLVRMDRGHPTAEASRRQRRQPGDGGDEGDHRHGRQPALHCPLVAVRAHEEEDDHSEHDDARDDDRRDDRQARCHRAEHRYREEHHDEPDGRRGERRRSHLALAGSQGEDEGDDAEHPLGGDHRIEPSGVDRARPPGDSGSEHDEGDRQATCTSWNRGVVAAGVRSDQGATAYRWLVCRRRPAISTIGQELWFDSVP